MVLEQDKYLSVSNHYHLLTRMDGANTMSILEWKPAQKDTLENRIKKIKKILTRIFWANNDEKMFKATPHFILDF